MHVVETLNSLTFRLCRWYSTLSMHSTHACRDYENLNDVLLEMIREQRKVSIGEALGDIKKKDSMKAAEDKLVQVGKKARNEVRLVH